MKRPMRGVQNRPMRNISKKPMDRILLKSKRGRVQLQMRNNLLYLGLSLLKGKRRSISNMKDISMIEKVENKWVAKCDICDWKGKFDSKEEAREKLLEHLDEHRAPRRGLEEEEEEGGISSPPESWPEPRNPGGEPPGND
ncbi:hypothetical protein GF319_05120 [Candidatus Bathyarchaeota archaeon]|nr:hypothetical protein [Candidatus Bathyarchaeota archaeon]